MEKLEKISLRAEQNESLRKGRKDFRPFVSDCFLFVYDNTNKVYDAYLYLADDCTFDCERTFKADDWKYHVYRAGVSEIVLKRVNRITNEVEWLTGTKAEIIDHILDVYNASAVKPDIKSSWYFLTDF